MNDIVKARGDQIDIDGLSRHLGAPIVTTTATRNEGIEELKETIFNAIPAHFPSPRNDADRPHSGLLRRTQKNSAPSQPKHNGPDLV